MAGRSCGFHRPAALRVPVTRESGSFPWFLPDGQHFLFQGQAGVGVGVALIRVASLDGAPTVTIGTGSNALYAQGHLLFLREGTLMAQPFDAERLTTTGEAVPVAEQVQSVLNSGRVGVFSVSKPGYWPIGKALAPVVRS